MSSAEFESGIKTLQEIKEKLCPREMLQCIEQTFKQIEAAALKSAENPSHSDDASANESEKPQPNIEVVQLNADNMMPIAIYLTLRAAIPHFGTEIMLLEDLMGSDFEFVMNGFAGYCFTTLKAAYQHIINDSFLQ